jgi:hypothetical protein
MDDENIFVLGGYDGVKYSKYLQKYDLISDKWF